jgi:hypothetical protein
MKTIKQIITVVAIAMFMLSSFTGNAQGTGRVDPINFAKLHNEYLLKAVNVSIEKKLSPKDAFLHIKIPNIRKEEQAIIFDYFTKMSVNEKRKIIFKSLTNPKAKEYYNEIDLILDKSKNISELNMKLDKISLKINDNLTKNDWDIVMVYLETIKSSAYFWYPKDKGGSGLGTPYIDTHSKKKKLPGWVRADGAGAGMGMAFWGLSGLFVAGPVGGVAGFLYGAVSGAVSSSMMAHIEW